MTGDESSPAEDLFAGFLADVEDGVDADFDGLCREHSEYAEELRALHVVWERFESVIGELDSNAASGGEPQPPEHPRYRSVRRIAAGGMGVVYEVLDAQLGRHLAMKVVRDGPRDASGEPTPASSRRRARFVDEARITGQLEHPGIVPIHELGTDAEGGAWFTMRLVEGRTLTEIFDLVERDGHAREGPNNDEPGRDPAVDTWSLTRALEVLRRVCETMAFAHSRGVIHRDLKPANVMVGPFGEVYVMDWGLARPVHALDESELQSESSDDAGLTTQQAGVGTQTLEGDVVGTPAYMPPEQADGRLDAVGPQSDVYAAGAMLYHLLDGRAPFAGAGSAGAMLEALKQGPPPSLGRRTEQHPPELVAITERAMRRDPSERYADMLAFARDLRAFLEGRVVSAYETGVWPELKKWVGRNRVLSASMVIALSLGLLAALAVARTTAVRNAERAFSQRFEDLELLEDLEREAAELWPVLPNLSAATEGWRERADALALRLAEHQERLEAEGASVNAWARAKLGALIERLERFFSSVPEPNGYSDVARRVAKSSAIREFAASDAYRQAWSARLAALAADARFASLQLAPTEDLLPRPDRELDDITLFEHLPSASLERLVELAAGQPSARSEPFGPESGVFLVLVPAADGEAFFASRFELTRAQYGRLVCERVVETEAALMPQANISWIEAARAVGALGLELPTPAQFDRLMLRGLETRFWWGDELELLPEHEVVNSSEGARRVGSGSANPLGLFDTLGNVAEWERYPLTSVHPRALTGEALFADGFSLSAVRAAAELHPGRSPFGGWFRLDLANYDLVIRPEDPTHARSVNTEVPFVGVRPVRPLVLPSLEPVR